MNRQVTLLPLAKIKVDADQPRKTYDAQELNDLAANIKIHGIINPIEVDDENVIVAGERRYRAAKLAGLKEIPAFVVENLKHREMRQLSENLLREDMNPLEIAEALVKLKAKYKCTNYRLSKMLGKPPSYASEKMRVLRDPPEVLVLVRERKATTRHAQILRNVPKEFYKMFYDGLFAGGFRNSMTMQRCLAYVKNGGDIEAVQDIIRHKLPELAATERLAYEGLELKRRVDKAVEPGKRIIQAANNFALLMSQARKHHLRVAPLHLPRVILSLNTVRKELDLLFNVPKFSKALKEAKPDPYDDSTTQATG